VAKFRVIGPYFFEENGRSVTVNSARYVVMSRNFLIPELRRRRLNQFQIWFQQDGATANTSRKAMAELRMLFPGKLISHRGDVPWPSPLSGPVTLRFLFVGVSQRKSVRRQATRFAELRAIPRQMCEQVMTNFSRRLNDCVQNKGRHLNNVIYHV